MAFSAPRWRSPPLHSVHWRRSRGQRPCHRTGGRCPQYARQDGDPPGGVRDGPRQRQGGAPAQQLAGLVPHCKPPYPSRPRQGGDTPVRERSGGRGSCPHQGGDTTTSRTRPSRASSNPHRGRDACGLRGLDNLGGVTPPPGQGRHVIGHEALADSRPTRVGTPWVAPCYDGRLVPTQGDRQGRGQRPHGRPGGVLVEPLKACVLPHEELTGPGAPPGPRSGRAGSRPGARPGAPRA